MFCVCSSSLLFSFAHLFFFFTSCHCATMGPAPDAMALSSLPHGAPHAWEEARCVCVCATNHNDAACLLASACKSLRARDMMGFSFFFRSPNALTFSPSSFISSLPRHHPLILAALPATTLSYKQLLFCLLFMIHFSLPPLTAITFRHWRLIRFRVPPRRGDAPPRLQRPV